MAITFALGGADADRFSITASGDLAMRELPDFESPLDANRDNVYQVRVVASDGNSSAGVDLQVRVTDQFDTVRVRRVATGYAGISTLAGAPPNLLMVGERTGAVYFQPVTGGPRSLAFRVTDMRTDGERGLLGIGIGPEFAQDGTLFVSHSSLGDGIVVRRFVRDFFGTYVGEQSPVVLIPLVGDRNLGGWIGFGDSANLYIAVGDGEPSVDPAQGAQDRFALRGKILRMARNPDPFAGATPLYYIGAPGNPFRNGEGSGLVYATGLRNPAGGGFVDGNFVFVDRGGTQADEVNVLRFPADAGANFGWPYHEGNSNIVQPPLAGRSDPVIEMQKGTAVRPVQALVGGYVYTGTQGPLARQYVMADSQTGAIWSIPDFLLTRGDKLTAAGVWHRTRDFVPDQGSIGPIVAFAQGTDGNIYFADSDGEIFVIER